MKEYVLAILAGYLLGSIPVALLVARRHGVDLFRTGDGNPGAWNALEQLGGRRAWPAFIGDAAKATLAGAIGHLLAGYDGAVTGVAAALLGHAFPLFTRFRGGKAVMSFAGGAFALSPLAAGVALAACGLVSVARSFAVGARVGIFGFPLLQWAFDGAERVAGTGALMMVVGILFFSKRGRATSAEDAPSTA